jgi:hypothetical protein
MKQQLIDWIKYHEELHRAFWKLREGKRQNYHNICGSNLAQGESAKALDQAIEAYLEQLLL